MGGFLDRITGRIVVAAGVQRYVLQGAMIDSSGVGPTPQLIAFDNVLVVSPITPTSGGGLWVRISASVNAAYTLNVPALPAPPAGALLLVTVRNVSGGALGVMTWGAGYKLGAAWVQPANGFSRSITFQFDGTNYVEVQRTAADVAN